jgi:hypothetical protein
LKAVENASWGLTEDIWFGKWKKAINKIINDDICMSVSLFFVLCSQIFQPYAKVTGIFLHQITPIEKSN